MVLGTAQTGAKQPIVFDLDRTITKADTYLPFLWECRVLRGFRYASALTLPADVALYYAGRITNATLKERFLTKTIGNIDRHRLEFVVAKFVGSLLSKGLNPFIDRLLADYIAKGHKVILATASFDFYVSRIAESLGIGNFVCSHAEFQNNRLTGRILGRNCYGIEKLHRIQATYGSDQLARAAVFTDHYSDFPILASAQTGILVNPNNRTRKFMHKKGYRLKPLASPISMSRLHK